MTRYRKDGSSQWKIEVKIRDKLHWTLYGNPHALNEAQAVLDNKEKEEGEKNKLGKLEKLIYKLQEKIDLMANAK